MDTTDTPISGTELVHFDFPTQAEIQKRLVSKEELRELADKYKFLTIADTSDKDGARAVDEARKDLKRRRNIIRGAGKDTRDAANKFAKMVIAIEDELVEIIEPVERELERRFDENEAEKQRLAEIEQKREDDRIQDLLNQLRAVEADMDIYELKTITPERFEAVLKEATVAFQKKQIERAEQERLIEIEKAAERERQRVEAEKQAEERRQFEEDQRRVKEERDRLAEEEGRLIAEKKRIEYAKIALAQEKADMRYKRLYALGLKWDGLWMCYHDIRVAKETIATSTDPEFEDLVRTVSADKEIIDQKAEAARQQELIDAKMQAAQEEIVKSRIRDILNRGFQYGPDQMSLVHRKYPVTVVLDKKFKELNHDEYDELMEEVGTKVFDFENEDKEQQSRNADDAYRFGNLAQQIEVGFLQSSIWTMMKSKKGKEVAGEVLDLLKQAHKLCSDNKRK